MVARLLLILVGICQLTACISQTQTITKIVLLAPFEGLYQEIGYNALYASRLAITDSNLDNVDLLAIDDGGTVEIASERVAAIAQDPSIEAIITLGSFATSQHAQSQAENIPMLIVGHWNTAPINTSAIIFTHPDIESSINWNGTLSDLQTESAEVSGSEILSLLAISSVLNDLSNVRVSSSASLPDDDFIERYMNSAEFAPEPNLLATLTYDVTNIVLQSIETDMPIHQMEYTGINGNFIFSDGYWHSATIYEYQYDAQHNLVFVED